MVKRYKIPLWNIAIVGVLWCYCHPPAHAQIESIHPDKITKCFVEFGGGVGTDYLILWGTLIANINVYPIQFRHFKISVNNEVGILVPCARILYYYPSAQMHFHIKDRWFLLGMGREYTNVKTDLKQFDRTIDYRIDIGMKFYTSDNSTVTFTIPLRIDDEIPILYGNER